VITAAAANGAGTALASEEFTRWAGDVAVYRDLRNIDPALKEPLGPPPRSGPLATEHERLLIEAPVAVHASPAAPQTRTAPTAVPA
jgi:hypothetical protein